MDTMETAGRRPAIAGFLLGFALGGFFDGILLHQVLQWHHLLSAVESARIQDIRVQILADGLFHALMYVIAAIGLWVLWRGRRELGSPGADRRLLALALIGFGVWHMLDGIVSHWLLGIHRIRMDVDNPLVWDLLWFVLFGVVVAAVGWWLLRGGGGRASGPRGSRGALARSLLVALVVIGGPVAALPPGDGEAPVMVLFRPGTSFAEAAAAVGVIDGRIVWSDASGQLMAVEPAAGARPSRLYGHGAMLVSQSLLPAGCLDWFR